ncbi:MAG: sodium:calcium antiporter [Pyrinomonadaceae bacterium]|nr:sodium:calcium antiporter [Pyrinomonadaceae bacterium]
MFFWISIAIAGAALTLIASRRAVKYASLLAQGLSLPPFFIGVTIVSIGTDIPEMSNSIIASIAGHGDLNVGDSIGSVMTQITLIFGLLPFFATGFSIDRARTLTIAGFTVLSLAIGIALVSDGYLSRLDGAILVGCWLLFTSLSWKYAPASSDPVLPMGSSKKFLHGILVVLFLALVGVGASAFVKGLIEISAGFDVPEYLISFFGASLGTSLPELAFVVTALRSGKRDLAVGDIVGACLVDATLSIGSGPLIAPTLVTAALSMRGGVIALVFVTLATVTVVVRKRHDRYSGALLLFLYGAGYFVFIAS